MVTDQLTGPGPGCETPSLVWPVIPARDGRLAQRLCKAIIGVSRSLTVRQQLT
jgi:hypothetical protein